MQLFSGLSGLLWRRSLLLELLLLDRHKLKECYVFLLKLQKVLAQLYVLI